jgi:rare lipoprotein A
MKVLYTILFTCLVLPKKIHLDATSGSSGMSFLDVKKDLQDDNDSENPKKSSNRISFGKRSLFGTASFYSLNLEGTETATGETFDHDGFTGASNNFKLNTWVKVTNLCNGKFVVVRINDRMHPEMAKKGRIIDLTRLAATKIGLSILSGLTEVKVEPLISK